MGRVVERSTEMEIVPLVDKAEWRVALGYAAVITAVQNVKNQTHVAGLGRVLLERR